MPRLGFVLILVFALCLPGVAQYQGWSTYLARRHTTLVEETDSKVFAVADGTLYAIDREPPYAISTYDRSMGLSDTGIEGLVWSPSARTMLIYYSSGLIDLLSDRGVTTITALATASQVRQRTLRSTALHGSRVWLAGSFGIVQVDVGLGVVEASYHLGSAASGIAVSADGTGLYAVINGCVLAGSLSANLQDPSQWHSYVSAPSSGGEWIQVSPLGNTLVGLSSKGKLWQLSESNAPIALTATFAPWVAERSFGRLVATNSGVLAIADDGACLLTSDLKAVPIELSEVQDFTGDASRGRLWAATGYGGISALSWHGNYWGVDRIPLDLSGPYANSYFAMRCAGGYLYTVNGGRDGDRYGLWGVAQVFDGQIWSAVTSADLRAQASIGLTDPIDIIPHRSGDPKHFYIATWGEGLYEIKHGALVERYDTHNSALASALPDREGYTRVSSLTYDSEGNLWMAQGLTENSLGGSIVRLAPSGHWTYYDYPSIRPTNSFHTHIAMPGGTKWLAEHRGNGGANALFVYHDNDTPDLSDDSYARYHSFADPSGRAVPFTRITAMALDHNATLWVGTNMGYMSVLGANQAPQEGRPPVVSRPIAGTEPSLYYVLDNTPVSAIAVDGHNRKWIGTEHQGLYLVSEDGRSVLQHYTKENSPLLQNTILSLAYDDVRGTLYIGTATGLNSLQTGTSPREKAATPTAIAYPNPLRPEHPDGITLEGLPAGATIRISNASGQVVHQGRSTDTTYRWETYEAGTRLSSGVYTARIYAPNGGSPQLIRIVIIRSQD